MEFVNLKTGEIVNLPTKEAAMKYYAEVAGGDKRWTPSYTDVITTAAYRQSVRRGKRR